MCGCERSMPAYVILAQQRDRRTDAASSNYLRVEDNPSAWNQLLSRHSLLNIHRRNWYQIQICTVHLLLHGAKEELILKCKYLRENIHLL
jgi:hypothetical protein